MSDIQVIGQLTELQQKVDNIYIPEQGIDFISPYIGLPGLIGFWPMATVQRSTGNVPNYAPTFSGATKQDLVFNGTKSANFNATSAGVPYLDANGTDNYLSVANNTDIDVQGNEAQYASPGITVGCWFWMDAFAAANIGIISKAAGAPQISFYLIINAGAQLSFTYSTNGSLGVGSSEGVDSVALSTGQWYFVAGRWTPSTERSGFVNYTKYQTASSAFATIYNSTSSLEIGRVFGGSLLNGRVALPFLCSSALPDAIIQSIFQKTKSLFGVV